jgi:hypothetical protein
MFLTITLSVFIGCFFASLLEPLLWSKGVVVQVFFWTHNNRWIRYDHESRVNYLNGMLCLVLYFRVLFHLMNGKLIRNHDATVISFYEFAGVFYIYLFFIPK